MSHGTIFNEGGHDIFPRGYLIYVSSSMSISNNNHWGGGGGGLRGNIIHYDEVLIESHHRECDKCMHRCIASLHKIADICKEAKNSYFLHSMKKCQNIFGLKPSLGSP